MSSTKNKFIIGLVNFFSFLIPKSFKRLVFISTLYSKGGADKIFDHVDFAKLNKNMNIASTHHAIESALCLQNAVWDGVDLNKLILEASKNELNGEMVPSHLALNDVCERIISNLPQWIQYNRDEMLQDVKSLFNAEPVNVHA